MCARARIQDLEDLSDSDLVQRFKAGDDGALEVLLRRHSEDLYRFCHHLVANREDAEDICQESLTRAIDNVESLQSGSAFRGWLFRIARNLCIDAFRHRRRTCTLLDDEVTPAPLRVDGPQSTVEMGEERQTVAQALSRLADSHQRVLLLREVEGLSYADISRRLNVSHSAVETLLFRARRRLREEYVIRDGGTSGLALLSGLRELLTRFADPVVGSTHLAVQTAVAAALIGGTVLSYSDAIVLRHPSQATHSAVVHRQTIQTLKRVSISTGSHATRAAPQTRRQLALNVPLGLVSRTNRQGSVLLERRPYLTRHSQQPLRRPGYDSVATSLRRIVRPVDAARLAHLPRRRARTGSFSHRGSVQFVTGPSHEAIQTQSFAQAQPSLSFGSAAGEQRRLSSFHPVTVQGSATIRWNVPKTQTISGSIGRVRASFGPAPAVTAGGGQIPQISIYRSPQSTANRSIPSIQTPHGTVQSVTIWRSPSSASRSINQPPSGS